MDTTPNTTKWPVGKRVLHVADAKRPEMVMRVLGYTDDGRCRTVYAEPNGLNGDRPGLPPTYWENDIGKLEDADRWLKAPKADPGKRIGYRIIDLLPEEVERQIMRTFAHQANELAIYRWCEVEPDIWCGVVGDGGMGWYEYFTSCKGNLVSSSREFGSPAAAWAAMLERTQ
jgi:hypothetical protein